MALSRSAKTADPAKLLLLNERFGYNIPRVVGYDLACAYKPSVISYIINNGLT